MGNNKKHGETRGVQGADGKGETTMGSGTRESMYKVAGYGVGARGASRQTQSGSSKTLEPEVLNGGAKYSHSSQH